MAVVFGIIDETGSGGRKEVDPVKRIHTVKQRGDFIWLNFNKSTTYLTFTKFRTDFIIFH